MNKNPNENKSKANIDSQDDVLLIKQEYIKPTMLALGDIRDVTMGGSPGFGDSGAMSPEDPF